MLNEQQLDHLEELLRQTRRLPIEGIDGLFCAAIVGPGQVMPSECIELIAFDDSEPWASPEQAEEAHSLLFELWNMVAARVSTPPDELESESLPLVDVPDRLREDGIDAVAHIDFPFARTWAHAFMLGTRLRKHEWDRWFETDPASKVLFQTLTALLLSDNPAADLTPLTFRQRLELLNTVPVLLWEINLHRLDELHPGTIRHGRKVGRNDPCPCGSGKKYKKCCG